MQSNSPLKLLYRTSLTLENNHLYHVYLFEIMPRGATPDGCGSDAPLTTAAGGGGDLDMY
jgi:hypothetical protein